MDSVWIKGTLSLMDRLFGHDMGDEFVILLNHTGDAGAIKVCSRIYKSCKDYVKNDNKKTFYLSISLGFATKLTLNQS
ncbi:MAG: hypothetical protein JJE17_07540 [Peptostreptococcaceae bacterium]|nr:hypothetical protein [Peptostreptococcaceae bacterium]